ncbi:conserved hypothetical protein [Neospora caninum Liverpool]|uniref:Uncharacterized protein n=1 Tax=Neospora caninum (strain Liverpool) TaxID=572307 RepID=F0VEB9_NEOCL|nr:conserved hypothetical protein [Neospora caninum Liverpool]CBZ52063.1 conserved hypothetical protein [Neospora caninum Liverpool]CEL66024.1 TPA: hypothetical protein BN1204_018530 [Neospora caninum Liverpool]|eukprot:XP_003882095.1 conserved hypothetical protein [Neospora caninum Liverpool]
MRQFTLSLLVLLPLLQRPESVEHAVQSTLSASSASLFPSSLAAEATRARHRASTLEAEDGASAGDDEDAVLTEQDQESEDECAAQEVMQKMLQDELNGSNTSLMAASPQWKLLKSNLEQHMDNKEMCAPLSGSQPVCRQIQKSDDGEVLGSATTQLKCGGAEYEKLIEKYVHEKNCLTAVAFSHALAQSWLGHLDPSKASGGSEVARKGIVEALVSHYHKAMDAGFLDDTLWYIYQDAAALLEAFKTAATDGLNAFNSEDVRKALLRRRETQTAIFCSVGNGNDAQLGSNVIVNEGTVIFRVNLDGEDMSAVEAFKQAVDTFAKKFVQAVLEEGGLLDRAIELHKKFYKFRFFKIQGLMQSAEPSADVREQNKLLAALPLEKHKTKEKHPESSFLQVGAGVQDEPQQLLAPVAPTVASVATGVPAQNPAAAVAMPIAPAQVAGPTGAAAAVQADPYLSAVPAASLPLSQAPVPDLQPVVASLGAQGGVQPAQPMPTFQMPAQIPSPPVQAPAASPVALPAQPDAGAPGQAAVAQPSPAAPGQAAVAQPSPAAPGQAAVAQPSPAAPGQAAVFPGAEPTQVASGAPGANLAGVGQSRQVMPPLSPLEVYEQGAQRQPSGEGQQQVAPDTVKIIQEKPSTPEEAAREHESRPQPKESEPRHRGALGALGERGHLPEMPYNTAQIPSKEVKAVPIKQKVMAVMSRLRMLQMHNDTVAFEVDSAGVEKIVKAAYLDVTDRVFGVWGGLLPQAAVTTTAQLLTLLLPKPDVDVAEFYNKTMNSEGAISDGVQDQLPVNHTRLVERFAIFVEEMYRDCWRKFFNTNDNFLAPANDAETDAQDISSATSIPEVSAVQLNAGKVVDLLANGVVERGLDHAASMEAVVKEHSFVSTASAAGERGIDMAIVDSSDGIGVADLAKVFTDEQAVRGLTEKALSSSASTVVASTSLIALAVLTVGASS